MQSNKKFWTIVLVLSTIFFLALCLAPAEVYLGWNMPFVNINQENFVIFGHNIPDPGQQLGIMLMCGVLMMLPARLMPLAITKLWGK